MSAQLAKEECVPCKVGGDALNAEQLKELAPEVPEWTIVDEHHLYRRFKRKDFQQALDLVNRIGEIAEAQGHHPNISFTWGKVEVTIWTHKVDGLTRSDFVLAAKIDQQAES